MKKLFVLLTIFLAGCNAGTEEKRVALPYYSECESKLEGYFERLDKAGFSVNYKVEMHERQYDAHSSLQGVLFIYYPTEDAEEIHPVVNGVESLCFPISYSKIPNNASGLRILNNDIKTNKSLGIDSNFVIFSEESIYLYQSKNQ